MDVFTKNTFQLFSSTHFITILTIFFSGTVLLYLKKKSRTRPLKSVRYVLSFLLIVSVIIPPIIIFLREGTNSLENIHQTGYPFYFCDLAAIVLAIALITLNQRLVEVGYLWGVAGTTQGLITPVVNYDFPSLEFLAFFLQHGGVPITAILLVFGFKIYPTKGAFKRVWIWTWSYMILCITFNHFAHTNYGFFNGKPETPTAYDYLGPYPWYLVTLHIVACIFFAILLLPFRKTRQSV